MKKWNVIIQFTIQADSRGQAWVLAESLCRTKLRDLANVERVSLDPLTEEDAKQTIAINEPIGVAIIS